MRPGEFNRLVEGPKPPDRSKFILVGIAFADGRVRAEKDYWGSRSHDDLFGPSADEGRWRYNGGWLVFWDQVSPELVDIVTLWLDSKGYKVTKTTRGTNADAMFQRMHTPQSPVRK